MSVNVRPGLRQRRNRAGLGRCQQWVNNLVVQKVKGQQVRETVRGKLVAARIPNLAHKPFCAQFFQVIGGLTGLVGGTVRRPDGVDLCYKLGNQKTSGLGGQRDNGANDGADTRVSEVQNRIRCVSSNRSSFPYNERHQTRNPPGDCASVK